MGGLDEEVKDQKEETKIVDLDEEKKKRKPFHYWTVGGRDYRLKLKASNIEKLEKFIRQEDERERFLEMMRHFTLQPPAS